VTGVLEGVAGLDAQQRLVRGRVLGVEVVDVAGRDQRQPQLRCQRVQLRVDALLVGKAGVLKLDVRGVAAEDLREAVEVGARVGRTVLSERLAHPAREAAREGDQAARVPLEQLPVDPRLVVVALQIAERRELDQVGVPLVVLREQRQVRVALALEAAVVADVDLAADDRLDPVALRLAVERDGSGERAMVGERHRRHLEARGLLAECRDPAGPVEDRILGVDVQVNERGTHGSAIVLAGPDGSIAPDAPRRHPLPCGEAAPRTGDDAGVRATRGSPSFVGPGTPLQLRPSALPPFASAAPGASGTAASAVRGDRLRGVSDRCVEELVVDAFELVEDPVELGDLLLDPPARLLVPAEGIARAAQTDSCVSQIVDRNTKGAVRVVGHEPSVPALRLLLTSQEVL
jgi:hypothetical protein